MNISLNWIKDFVNLDGIDVKDIWHRFTMSAAEVEDVVEKGRDIQNVVVGKVIDVKPHPDSKKLSICLVDTGKEVVQSLCGAPNVKVGIKVPFALAGGSIKKIEKIGKVKVAGEESNGIICSAMEIGISDSHEGVMILPGEFEAGKSIKEYLNIDDIIIEVDNKSITHRPDLWGHYGIAREMAAIFGRRLKKPEIDELPGTSELPGLDIEIRDSNKCSRYCGIEIRDVKGGTTPLDMQIRLYYCGMRPIEPIVDLTNYIMLETGQPMHAFDRRFIEKLVVDSTKEDIVFNTLDGVERKIPPDTLMIYNNDTPVAVAGIMGGENSEISENTMDLFLESASFNGYSTRKSSMLLGLRTEASARFEKSLDPLLPEISIKRFVKLLKEIKSDINITSRLTDIFPVKPAHIEIKIDKPYIDKYIGHSIEDKKIVDILNSLEFSVTQNGDEFNVKVPGFRATRDISIKADLVEEITRIYGYDNIEPETVDVILKPLDFNNVRLTEHKIRDILAINHNINEIHSYVWYDNDFNKRAGIIHDARLKLINPHAKNMDILRNSMVPSMLQAAEGNARFFDEYSIFEIGSIFNIDKKGGECKENKSLCVLLASRTLNEDSLFYKLKSIVSHMIKVLKKIEIDFSEKKPEYVWMHPAKSINIKWEDNILGYISVVHPQICKNIDRKMKFAVMEIDMRKIHALSENEILYEEPSRYPEVYLDFSFLVNSDIPYDKVNEDIEGFKDEILKSLKFIDIYTGKGLPQNKKSMTFRFTIGSSERTLSSGEIDEFTNKLLDYMDKLGYTLR